MNTASLVTLLDATLARWAESREELRELDAAVGDGDLGVTVASGCAAVRERIAPLAGASPAEVIKQAGMAFASANPSTLAALVGGSLLAGAKSLGGVTELGSESTLACARAAAASIQARGKAELGDKTILDALLPSLDAAEAAPDGERLAAATEAARQGVAQTAQLQSRRGRAAWLGERSAGHADPGATAYLRLIEALQQAVSKGSQ